MWRQHVRCQWCVSRCPASCWAPYPPCAPLLPGVPSCWPAAPLLPLLEQTPRPQLQRAVWSPGFLWQVLVGLRLPRCCLGPAARKPGSVAGVSRGLAESRSVMCVCGAPAEPGRGCAAHRMGHVHPLASGPGLPRPLFCALRKWEPCECKGWGRPVEGRWVVEGCVADGQLDEHTPAAAVGRHLSSRGTWRAWGRGHSRDGLAALPPCPGLCLPLGAPFPELSPLSPTGWWGHR